MDHSVKITISPLTVNGVSGHKSDGDFSIVNIGELNVACYASVSWELSPFEHRALEEYQSLKFADHRQNSQISYIAPGSEQNVGGVDEWPVISLLVVKAWLRFWRRYPRTSP